MQLADILSDLQTLRTCDPQDALNLVELSPTTKTEDTDEDFFRAREFLQLHSTLKARDAWKLEELREKVKTIVDRKLGSDGEDDLREVNAPGGF
ncbi:hypothetical protein L211DRAFT_842274 [Terfezia boudieri ATCC MYA-4762]|uniref:Uncharacterized protein n=1 Tax=Terfezia boudieri ATCC MYA-4762 TaxID=1051890 RepID=A0A3N4LEH0_9PEZI|nr:hypothetical protein L211DRAFT_842274 [Terfezia boudieri ATCC MYA-4762]